MVKKGFTLIELLVVVAIIAILAAIAVPNFLEAQVRSKVSRMKADMRSLATAIEMYAVDHNGYPYDFYEPQGSDWDTWRQITTPIAYMTTVPLDFFAKPPQPLDYGYYKNRPTVEQIRGYLVANIRYVMLSIGPDRLLDYTWGIGGEAGYELNKQIVEWSYDPTNGTISAGDIIRTNKGI